MRTQIWKKSNVTDNTIDMIDIPQEVKEKFTGGKGYCLRYLWDATKPDTKWNSPENAITMSAGPIPESRSTAVPENVWYAAFHR